MSPKQEDWQNQGDTKALQKPRHRTLQLLLSTLLFVGAACAIYIAFWCPVTQSLKFFGRCTTFEESVIVPNATSTDTENSDRDNDNDDDYDSAASSFEVGSDLVIPDGEEENGNDGGGDEGSGPRTTTIVNNIYQTDTTVVESETSTEDGDFVTLTFIRKQVDRIYDYFNDRFEEIAQEFTTRVLNVTENINIDGSFTDNSNSVGDLGDVLVSTETGVVWMATSSLGFSATVIGGDGPAGDDMQVQFNNDGAFGASSSFVWDTEQGMLGVGTDDLTAALNIQGSEQRFYNGTPGENLVSNSSFDTDAAGWILECAEWNDGAVTVTYTTDDCGGSWAYVTTEGVGVSENVIYQITFTLSGVENGGAYINVYDDDNTYYSSDELFGNGTHTIEFVSRTSLVNLEAGVWEGNEGETFTIDDVELQEIGYVESSDNPILIARNSVEQELMRLTNEGRLGLGSDSPMATLHVRGAGLAETGSFGNIISEWFDFDPLSNDSWGLGDCAVWNFDDVVVTYTSCNDPFISLTVPVEVGGTYELEFTLSDVVDDEVSISTSGPIDDGEFSGTLFGNGTHIVTFSSEGSGTATLTFALDGSVNDASFAIDEVFVRQTGRFSSDATILVENGGGDRMLWLGEGGYDVVSIGRSAGDAENSNFIGAFAGAGIGGASVTMNFLGNYAGYGASNVSGSVFIGDRAGFESESFNSSIFIGQNAGYGDVQTNGCVECGYGSNILIGAESSTGGYGDSIAIGYGAANTAVQQFLVGNVTSAVFTRSDSDEPFFSVSRDEGGGAGSLAVGTAPIVSGFSLSGNSIIHNSDTAAEMVGDQNDPPFFLDDTRDVAVQGDYAYVANGSEGITILDIGDPTAPSVYDTFNTSDTAESIFIVGNNAYVTSGSDGLHVMSISGYGSLSLLDSEDTSGNAVDVYVSDHIAYVADGADGLQIIDVSDPGNPNPLVSFDTAGTAQGIFVSGKMAYIAGGTAGLQIIDVSDPTTPVLLGTYNTAGDAQDVYVAGHYAYVADGVEGMHVIDISDPVLPVLSDSYTANEYSSVVVSGVRAYVGGVNGFGIVDITNPTNVADALFSGENVTTGVRGIAVANGYVYLARERFEDYSTFDIFSVSGVNTPSVYTTSVETQTLSVLNDMFVGGDIYAHSFKATATSSVLGYFGIGTTTPSAQLTTTGTVRFAGFGAGSLQTDALGNVTVSSDERLKDLHDPFMRGIADLIKINPVTYTWKEETGYDTATVYTGFSAQNVQDAIPEAVATDTKGFLTLSDRPILAAVVNAVKEIWERLTGQEERINELENRIRALESQQGIYYETGSEDATPIEIVPEDVVPEPGDTDEELPLGEVETETPEPQIPPEVPEDTDAPLPPDEPSPAL